MKCVIDRSFKICNNWNSFHNGIENNKSNLIKNGYLPFLITIVIKKYLDRKFSSNQNQLIDTPCFDSNNSLCFKIIDKTNSKFDLKIKEA